jgi:hypothetical protein
MRYRKMYSFLNFAMVRRIRQKLTGDSIENILDQGYRYKN